MPWRLLVFIVVFVVFLTFITFNLENRCDISFGFTIIEDVPVFLTVFGSFFLGFFCTLPLAMLIKKKHKHKEPVMEYKPKSGDIPAEISPKYEPDDKIKKDAASARKKFFSKRAGG